MKERFSVRQVAEFLHGRDAIPFFFVPQIGFISGGDMKELNDAVGNVLNPLASMYKNQLDEYHFYARVHSPHTAYYKMTGKSHGHLTWIARLSRFASIPDYQLQDYFDQQGIFSNETSQEYRFYTGRHPERFTDEYLVKIAVANLQAAQRPEKGISVVDCRDMSEERFETIGDFINDKDVVEYVGTPAPFYHLDDPDSLLRLAFVIRPIATERAKQLPKKKSILDFGEEDNNPPELPVLELRRRGYRYFR